MSLNYKRTWYGLLIIVSVLWVAFIVAVVNYEKPQVFKDLFDVAGVMVGGLILMWGGSKVIEWIVGGLTSEDSNKRKGWLRIWVVLSVLWVVGTAVSIEPWVSYHVLLPAKWGEWIGIGIVPLVVFWGLIWIISGFKGVDNQDK